MPSNGFFYLKKILDEDLMKDFQFIKPDERQENFILFWTKFFFVCFLDNKTLDPCTKNPYSALSI